MKKNVVTLYAAAAASLLLIGGVTSCGNNNGKGAKKVINIQFVPSNDPGKLAILAKNMEPMLEKIEPDYKFKITTGDSYAATTTGLLSNQLDIGFLTASGYAEATVKHPGKVEVLMTSVRKGYQVQQDYKGEADQRKAMNGEIEGYEYLGQQSDLDVNWYSSQLVVSKECYKDANNDGKIDILDMAGKKLGRQGSTSGAGYLRPLKYLNDNGMKMVSTLSKDPIKNKEVQGVEIKGYTAACEALMAGDIDGFWGYTDVRYSNFYSKKDSTHFEDKKLFTDYKVMAITDGIYNDTISCRANLEPEIKAAVKNAFKTLIKDGDKNEEGTGAYYLYNLYSHTGYTDAKDEDFEGERQFYKFCIDNNII